MMIVLTSDIDFEDIIAEYDLLDFDDVLYSKSKMLIGAPEIYSLAIVLAPTMIASIAQVVVALLNSKREFKIKEGDKEIELKGYSEKKIISLFEQIYKKSENFNNTSEENNEV